MRAWSDRIQESDGYALDEDDFDDSEPSDEEFPDRDDDEDNEAGVEAFA